MFTGTYSNKIALKYKIIIFYYENVNIKQLSIKIKNKSKLNTLTKNRFFAISKCKATLRNKIWVLIIA